MHPLWNRFVTRSMNHRDPGDVISPFVSGSHVLPPGVLRPDSRTASTRKHSKSDFKKGNSVNSMEAMKGDIADPYSSGVLTEAQRIALKFIRIIQV